MEREKMITEIADKIEQSFLEESRKDENKTYLWQELPVFRSVCERIASSLVSQNVRIITEDAVVLTKEEYDGLCENAINGSFRKQEYIQQAIKNTVSEARLTCNWHTSCSLSIKDQTHQRRIIEGLTIGSNR